MKLPYSHVHTIGDLAFAARGGTIYSFNVSTGSYISTWKHPDVEKQATLAAEAQVAASVAEVSEDVDMAAAAQASDEPPAKRQRRDENGDASKAGEAGVEGETTQGQEPGGKKKGKKAKGRSVSQRAPQVDRALIVLITSTDEGKYLVAVSGHDKIIWVFEHDGEGHFREISQRRMPKRPIDLLVGPANTIITADKFGDVYSLPLLFDPSETPKAPSTPSLSVPKAAKPAATTLTVHSKRNRQSLEAQLRMYEERERNGGGAATPKAEEPNFELSLLLGHVSMLTALTLGKSDGRNYILTADRDEHVRVSRYIPQAHVIEGFCLGHREFIASMVIPAGREHVLVSGGGDTDLFVWDWKKGERLSTTNVLSLAQVVAPGTSKVAVSSLTTLAWPTDEGFLSYVLAICEDIKAIFAWQLTEDNRLNHPSAIQLPGNPLQLSISPSSSPSAPPRIIVAIDPSAENAASKSLNVFTLTMHEGRLSTDQCSSVDDEALSAAEMEVAPEEVRALLYGVEQLRKQEMADEEEPEPLAVSGTETGLAAEATAEQ